MTPCCPPLAFGTQPTSQDQALVYAAPGRHRTLEHRIRPLDVHFINTLPVLGASRHSRESGNPGGERYRDLDARLRGHDVLLAQDLRNRHLDSTMHAPAQVSGMFQDDPTFEEFCDILRQQRAADYQQARKRGRR